MSTRYVLLNGSKRPLMVVEAMDAYVAAEYARQSVSGCHGAVVAEDEYAAPFRRLQESARKRFLAQGKAPDVADRMAVEFARGRHGSELDTSRLPFRDLGGVDYPFGRARMVKASTPRVRESSVETIDICESGGEICMSGRKGRPA